MNNTIYKLQAMYDMDGAVIPHPLDGVVKEYISTRTVSITDNMFNVNNNVNGGLLICSSNIDMSRYILTTASSNLYYNIDFKITTPVSNNIQTILSAIDTSTGLNYLQFTITTNGIDQVTIAIGSSSAYPQFYHARSAYTKLNIGLNNVKLVVFSGGVYGLYVNDRLCISNNITATSRYAGISSTVSNLSKNTKFMFGGDNVFNTTYGMIGSVSNFKCYSIYSNDPCLYDNTLYGKNKLVHITFNYKATGVQNVSFTNHIHNIGTTIGLDVNHLHSNAYRDKNVILADDSVNFSWQTISSSYPVYINYDYIKTLSRFSISFKIRFNKIKSCSILDTRIMSGDYSGFLVTLPSADPTMLKLYLSSGTDTATDWATTIESPTGSLVAGVVYDVSVIFDNGDVYLYLNDVKVGESIGMNIKPNYKTSNLYFGCNSALGAVASGYLRDIRIYDAPVLPSQDVVIDPMVVSNDPVVFSGDYHSYDSDNTVVYETINDTSLKVFTSDYGNLTIPYEYNPLNYYIEGGDGDEIIIVKRNGVIFGEYIGSFKYDYFLKTDLVAVSVNGSSNIIPVNLSDIKGELIGSLQLKNCLEITNPTFKVKCISSSDNRYIGTYDLVNNQYRIPNLDATKEYDIILVDQTNMLEQRILSNRKPIPYQ